MLQEDNNVNHSAANERLRRFDSGRYQGSYQYGVRGAQELSEDIMLQALLKGHGQFKELI